MPDALTNTAITAAELDAFTDAGRQRYVANRPGLQEALSESDRIDAQIAELKARQAALWAREDVVAYNRAYHMDWLVLWTWVVMGEHPDWPEERANLHAKALAVAEWDKGGMRGGATQAHVNHWRAQIELAAERAGA